MFDLLFIAFGLASAAGANAAKRLGDDDDGGLFHPDSGFLAGPNHHTRAGGGHSYAVQPVPQSCFAPPPTYNQGGGDEHIRIGANQNGQFDARCDLIGSNGRSVPVSMLVDTGATNTKITHNQARALGIDIRRLRYDEVVMTASGREAVGRFEIPEMRIHDASGAFWVSLYDIPSYVLQRDVSTGALLGMSALADLRVTLEGGYLTLS